MASWQLLVFTVTWIVALYVLDSLVARRRIRIEPKLLLVYVSFMAAFGVCGEIFADSLYNLVLGRPLWMYEFLPIHGGYTSVYSLFEWAALGFHMYLVGTIFKQKGITSIHVLAGFFCAEALVIEILINLTFLICFGSYVFFYLPGDIWHLTSIQALPLYLIAGYVAYRALDYAHRRPLRSSIESSALAMVLVGIGIVAGR